MPAEVMSTIFDNTVGAEEDTMVMWPGGRRITECSDRRPILFAHGHTGQENVIDFLRTDCRMLTALGGVMLSGDFGGPAEFGNDNSLQMVADTLAHARANGWCSNEPALTIGTSMGNLTCLNWGRANMSDIIGHISLSGAFDLSALHAGNYTAEIDAAYGAYSEATHGAEHNPVTYAASISGLPIITFYSPDDTVVAPEDEAAFASTHGNTTRNSVGGGVSHGAVPYVNPIGYLAAAATTLLP